MRWIAVLVALLIAGTAAAQPVQFDLKGDVPVGKKPMLKVMASEAVTGLVLDLSRDDGKTFTTRHPGLRKGQSVVLPIGDGAPGKMAYTGSLSGRLAGSKGAWTENVAFDTIVRAPLQIGYDADHLDLDKRTLQFRPSRPPVAAEIEAIGEDGATLGKGAATYPPSATGDWLAITWTPPAGKRRDMRVMKLVLRVEASDGTATRVELIPWSVTIDHQDVEFAVDSARIEPGEDAKLDASLTKIAEIVASANTIMPLRLYVAGHTDTVGASAKNRTLSLARAKAIATYFRKHGLKLPITIAGFGEDVPKVKTPDSTDERKNRRVDYVLGPATGAPPFKGPYLRTRADWKPLK